MKISIIVFLMFFLSCSSEDEYGYELKGTKGLKVQVIEYADGQYSTNTVERTIPFKSESYSVERSYFVKVINESDSGYVYLKIFRLNKSGLSQSEDKVKSCEIKVAPGSCSLVYYVK